MSKADKMFEALGFTKEEDNISIQYRKNNGCFEYLDILFYLTSEYIGLESEGDMCLVDIDTHEAIVEKSKELGWVNDGVTPLKKKDEEFRKDFPEEFADEVWYSYYCGNEGCTNSATFGPWDKYCSECGAKIDWNSYKTQESEVK